MHAHTDTEKSQVTKELFREIFFLLNGPTKLEMKFVFVFSFRWISASEVLISQFLECSTWFQECDFNHFRLFRIIDKNHYPTRYLAFKRLLDKLIL